MATPLPAYLDTLNEEQRRAVLHTGSPLLILAGAGSGKTRVITTKIAWLIKEKGLDPQSIMAVTFTNKAAREMAARAQVIEPRSAQAMLRTFHSFGAWFLRRHGKLAGLDPGFVIYDDDDSLALLATVMEGIPRPELRILAHNIARAKDYFLSPGDPELELIDHRKTFRRAYEKYQEKLQGIGNLDFGDLIKKPVELLRNHRDLAERFHERFRVVMVDEYQDANIAQSHLLKELYGPQTYLCVVGDDDQSIYSFRGAQVKNILAFSETFPKTEIIKLEQNYRSSSSILGVASSVVDHNRGRLGKTLRAVKKEGKKPVLAFLPDQDTESEFCSELIQKAGGYGDWAVVYRTNAQSLGFETEFLRRGIPYRVVGSLKFYEREEIKDALALLAFVVNPRDEVAFRRVVNKPSRGLGPAALDRIIEGGANLYEASKKTAPALSAKARSGIQTFLRAIEAGKLTLANEGKAEKKTIIGEGMREAGEAKQKAGEGFLKGSIGLSECVVTLAEESGIAAYHLSHDEVSGNQRLSNLQELANAASLYEASEEGLLEFLEHIELDRSLGEETAETAEAVTLITLHNTKGLEFKRVIMTGIEQGIFPREDKTGDDLEEERRLFYVGATRAMDELYISSCAYRRMWGKTMPMAPSIFLQEIDQKDLRIIGERPRSFAQTMGREERRPVKSSDGRWALGDRVYHDDQGYGTITQIREGDQGPVVKVIFENGQERRFLSSHQSSSYIKIGDD
ncbi:MAG: ATP-dependent helicase [Treponema sp.]|nr:ATP-dependent helicase [Treponema sp.]